MNSRCNNPVSWIYKNCGYKVCDDHSYGFRILANSNDKEDYLYCESCEGYVCGECAIEKRHLLGRIDYYCKKCGGKLLVTGRFHEIYRESEGHIGEEHDRDQRALDELGKLFK